ncbi:MULTISPECIES: cytosine permease [unclassified Curtobacterium]|jgi:NCS1 family nucleobase:cation symporter-1|uniref:purine-cytosine permease family protein n=1 Tax=unclassified Curtobacterium TaxID=257496 RepID=UPI0008F2174E|nr:MULTISPECIES: cytosine permease [unclassified Curtobacterium]MCT9622111.1 cytosine permease [Curtobacterium sp. C2H10]SFF74954.1 Purine-cytosine permease [Curtobacterium sp. YR515]
MSTAPEVRTVERQGTDVIAESDRKGRPRDLFWPWFAANISVLGLSYGSFVLGFGISFWQATIVSVIGVAFSFLLCGIVAIAGKRGSAPTMVLGRAAFGVRGNRLPAFLSWILTVGWETALASAAVLATSTVFRELGWDGGVLTKLVALVVVAALVVGAGIAGFDVIMRLQTWITVITAVLTIVYVVLALPSIDLGAIAALPAGSAQNVVGALVLVMTGFGLGWVNAAADYSRYLPRSASTRGVVWWTTFGGALAPIVLVVLGVLLAGSSKDLNTAIAADPIGALTTVLPVWFLIPFALVAVLGLVGGAVLDIYSSGLALLSAGIRIPRPVAAGVDGVFMVAGAVYVVFFADSFIQPFQAFLVTLGVPIAAWCGIFVADVVIRRAPYAERELEDRRGRYGDVRWLAVGLVVVGTALGWGLVTNTYGVPSWLNWQGYLLEPFGLGGRTGAWAYANLGVLVALVVGFLGTLLFARGSVRRQEQA